MVELTIRPGRAGDAEAAEGIYAALFDHYDQGAPNYTNWKRGLYPTGQDAEEALGAGTLHVGEWGGQVVACVNLNHVQPPEYAKVGWSVGAQGDEVLVVHTLCVHPEFSGKGIARGIVAYAEEVGKALGCKTIRMDTFEGNVPATRLYLGLGFADLGLEEFQLGPSRQMLRCFDKIL